MWLKEMNHLVEIFSDHNPLFVSHQDFRDLMGSSKIDPDLLRNLVEIWLKNKINNELSEFGAKSNKVLSTNLENRIWGWGGCKCIFNDKLKKSGKATTSVHTFLFRAH